MNTNTNWKKEVVKRILSIIFTLTFLIVGTSIWQQVRLESNRVYGILSHMGEEALVMNVKKQDVVMYNQTYQEELVLEIQNVSNYDREYQLSYLTIDSLSSEVAENLSGINYLVFEGQEEKITSQELPNDGIIVMNQVSAHDTVELTIRFEIPSYEDYLESGSSLQGSLRLTY